MYLNNLENIMNILNHVSFTSHEYVVRVAIFLKIVLFFKTNAWEDEWLVTIKVLQERKRKEK